MSKVPITFACGLYDRMQALYTGEVEADGIDLNFLAIDNPRQIFDRMGRNLEFDACEMSSSEVIRHHAAGHKDMVALPVFPSRVFRHVFLTVNSKFQKTPKDLEGKRIGTPLYSQTAAVFIRGMLADEYGVDLSGVHWIQGATNSPEPHGALSSLPQLKAGTIEQVNRVLKDELAAGVYPSGKFGANAAWLRLQVLTLNLLELLKAVVGEPDRTIREEHPRQRNVHRERGMVESTESAPDISELSVDARRLESSAGFAQKERNGFQVLEWRLHPEHELEVLAAGVKPGKAAFRLESHRIDRLRLELAVQHQKCRIVPCEFRADVFAIGRGFGIGLSGRDRE